MSARFVDTSVLLVGYGARHPSRESCRALIASAASGDTVIHASVEAMQEFAFHRLRRDSRSRALEDTRLVRGMCEIHPFDDEVLTRTLDLMSASEVRGRDAIHAATALIAGFSEIVTLDSDFAAVPGLTPVPPTALGRT